jgi:hypothetical protein
VGKEVQVAELPYQIQLPDLSQKKKDQKTKCRYYKSLFSGIA